MDSKVCIKCKENKLYTEFYKYSKRKNVISNICLKCKEQYNKEYRIKNFCKNKEKIKEWRSKNKEHIKIYESENAERIKEVRRKHYSLNKVERRAVITSWNIRNPEKVKISKKKQNYNVMDWVVIKYIQTITGLSTNEIRQLPPEIIKAKRELIKLNRAIRNHGKK